MSFNPDPSKPATEIIFSHKRKPPIHPPIFFNNVKVKQLNTHKHLGLILDSKLTFSSHINEKLSKARKGIGVIKYLSSYLPVKTLDQIYKMYVRPHLDFCDVIYHNPKIPSDFDSSFRLTNLMDQIESIQYQAALAVTGTWRGTSLNKIYDELGWEPLTDRRWFRRLVQFFKIYNGYTPDYLQNCLPTHRTNLQCTRSINEFRVMRCRTTSHMNSFFPHSVKIWNDLAAEFKEVQSLSLFKSKIIKHIRPLKRTVYGIYDPIGVKRLFQLRVGLSPLGEHKKRHKFNDTPSGICRCKTQVETTEHFLLNCNLYSEMRRDMFLVVNPILENNGLHLNNSGTISVLLYGHETLCEVDNTAILNATLMFIDKTARFV